MRSNKSLERTRREDKVPSLTAARAALSSTVRPHRSKLSGNPRRLLEHLWREIINRQLDAAALRRMVEASQRRPDDPLPIPARPSNGFSLWRD